MRQVSERRYGLAGGICLLIAVMLALVLAGPAGASVAKRIHAMDVDTTAPVTTDNAADMTSLPFELTFAATDLESGVQATYFRIDGGPWIAGTTVTIQLHVRHSRTGLAPGSHLVEYYSVDLRDNAEGVRSCTIVVTS